jgi:hypothetical protein
MVFMPTEHFSLVSVADPDAFDTDPDPAFHFDTESAFLFDTDADPYRFKEVTVMYL